MDDVPPRKRASLKKRLAAGALSLVFGLGLAEAIVRAFVPQSDFFTRSDPTLGVIGVPNLNGWMRDAEFTTHVSTNSYGFRDQEHSVAKPAGSKRVVVLGDSFTEGLQVELEETYHAQVEEKLKARLGKPLDLVAMGIGGTGTAQQMLVYEHVGQRFAPDVVLVTWFSGNDLHDNQPWTKYYFPGFDLGPGKDELVPVPWRQQIGSDGVVNAVVRSNYCQLLSFVARAGRRFWLVSEARKNAAKMAGASAPGPAAPPPAAPPPGPAVPSPAPVMSAAPVAPAVAPPGVRVRTLEEGWEITRRIFKRLRDECAANGARLVVATIPSREQLDQHDDGARVAELCRSLEIPCVDVAPALRAARAANPGTPLYFPRDSHFTRSGHAAIVSAIADMIAPVLQ